MSTEWSVHIVNIICYVLILLFSIKLYTKLHEEVSAVALGMLGVHGLIFNVVYFYRLLTWESCPPVCDLQTWSIVIRMHALLAIVTTMLYRFMKEQK